MGTKPETHEEKVEQLLQYSLTEPNYGVFLFSKSGKLKTDKEYWYRPMKPKKGEDSLVIKRGQLIELWVPETERLFGIVNQIVARKEAPWPAHKRIYRVIKTNSSGITDGQICTINGVLSFDLVQSFQERGGDEKKES